MAKYAHKIDSNQNQIVQTLRQLGFSVKVTSQLGKGFVDAVAGKNGVNYLIEIKDGKKPPSKRKLTPDEQKFHDEWKGTILTITSIKDIWEAFHFGG